MSTILDSSARPEQAARAESTSDHRLAWLQVALLTCLAGGLRFTSLDHQSLWMDEVLTVLSSRTSLARILFDPPVDPNIPPLYYLLMAALSPWGEGDTALRWPSAFLGTLSIPVIYAVAGPWLGRSVALFSGFLLAISPLHLWYSQEARPYALLIFLSLLAVYSLQRALASSRPFGPTVAFVVASAATFYTHTVALAFLGALVLYVLFAAPRERRGWWVAAFAAIALLCVPGVYLLIRVPPTVTANAFYVFNPSHVAYTLWTFVTGYSLGPNLIELRTEGLESVRRNMLLIASVLGLVFLLLTVALLHLWRRRRDVLAGLGPWWLGPIAFAVVGAFVTSHPYNVRYTLLALPPTLILLAAGTRFIAPRPARVAATVLLVACSLASLRNYYAEPRYHRDDNRGAAAYLQAHAQPHDLVIVSAGYTTLPLNHYLGANTLRIVGYPGGQAGIVTEDSRALGGMFVQADRVGEDLARIIGDRRDFWLFLSRTFHSDPDGHLQQFAAARYRSTARYVGPGVQLIHYSRPDPRETTVP